MPKKKKSVTDLVFSALKGDSPSTQKHRKKNKKLQNFDAKIVRGIEKILEPPF